MNHVKKHNPDVLFLLENVRMKKWCLRIISENVGLFPVFINSSLVSAQERKRWYWSNIRTKKVGLFGEIHTDIPQPKDRGIVLKDILEENVHEKYFLSEEKLNRISNAHKNFRPKINPVTAGCLTVNYGKAQGNNASTTFISIEGKSRTQRKSKGLSYDKKHNYQIIQLPRGKNEGGIKDKKCPTISANSFEQKNLRRLTPTECARLQTVPEWYKWECSYTQQYAMLGNGWTIEVIKHILSFLQNNNH